MASSITQLKRDIAVSLFFAPASLDELMTRDFLKTISQYGVDRLLLQLENDGDVYFRHKKYHAYKKIKDSSKYSEYELD